MEELPEIKKTYNKYLSIVQGKSLSGTYFEIISISLDTDSQLYANTISSGQYNWINCIDSINPQASSTAKPNCMPLLVILTFRYLGSAEKHKTTYQSVLYTADPTYHIYGYVCVSQICATPILTSILIFRNEHTCGFMG